MVEPVALEDTMADSWTPDTDMTESETRPNTSNSRGPNSNIDSELEVEDELEASRPPADLEKGNHGNVNTFQLSPKVTMWVP